MPKCEFCNNIQYIDSDGFCMKNGCPMLVIDRGVATKNYGTCDNLKTTLNNKYGTMAYQKEVENEKQN